MHLQNLVHGFSGIHLVPDTLVLQCLTTRLNICDSLGMQGS